MKSFFFTAERGAVGFLRNKNLAKQKEREKKHTQTQTCFLFPHPPSLELPFRLRSKVRAMRSSQKALESAFPSAAIFIFCLF